MRRFRKTVLVAALAGLQGASLATPASADGWGWGGHRHGWQGRPWAGGYGRRYDRWDHGGAAAAAALGGFALGAVAGAAAHRPHYGPAYGECYFVERPVTDPWGDVVEYRRVRICD